MADRTRPTSRAVRRVHCSEVAETFEFRNLVAAFDAPRGEGVLDGVHDFVRLRADDRDHECRVVCPHRLVVVIARCGNNFDAFRLIFEVPLKDLWFRP